MKFLPSMLDKVFTLHMLQEKARWYVKNMVGGFVDEAKRTDVNGYANGTVKDFKWYRLSYRYPKVKAGSTVVVGKRQKKEEREKRKTFQSE